MFDFFYRCFTHCWICLVCPLLCVHHGLQKVQYVSSVCDSVLFYQHTDLRLIIHRTSTQVGNPSQSEGSSSIMGYDGNKALALFSRTQRGNNRVKCLAHEHNLQVLQQRSSQRTPLLKSIVEPQWKKCAIRGGGPLP